MDPNGQELPSTATNENHNAEFKKKIEESKLNILNSQNPKRGPGRPKKIRPEQNQDSAFSTTQAAANVAIEPPPDLSNELKIPIQIISQIPANKHNIPELALSDSEAQAFAESINKVIHAFVPDVNAMDPKTASIVSLGIVITSIGYQKYAIFSQRIQERAKKDEKESDETPEKKPTLIVDSDHYFKTAHV